MSLDTIAALRQLGRDLDEAVPALESAERNRVAAEKAYKVAHARAYLSADGSNAQARDAQATLATADLWETAEVAEAVVRVQREHIKSLHARIDVGRSIFSHEKAIAERNVS